MNLPTRRIVRILVLAAASAGSGMFLVRVAAHPAAASANAASAAAPGGEAAQQASGSAARVAPSPKPSPVRMLELPVGTILHVRLSEELDTKRNRAGDTFTASLDSPVNVGGLEALPKNTALRGKITRSAASGRLRGRAVLSEELTSLELHGERYSVETSATSRVSGPHKNRNIVAIGGGSATGAMLGAIAGGGVGALIGAGAGAGAGVAGAALTGARNISLPAETLLTFRLKAPLRIKG
jgi:hypothetical protein